MEDLKKHFSQYSYFLIGLRVELYAKNEEKYRFFYPYQEVPREIFNENDKGQEPETETEDSGSWIFILIVIVLILVGGYCLYKKMKGRKGIPKSEGA